NQSLSQAGSQSRHQGYDPYHRDSDSQPIDELSFDQTQNPSPALAPVPEDQVADASYTPSSGESNANKTSDSSFAANASNASIINSSGSSASVMSFTGVATSTPRQASVATTQSTPSGSNTSGSLSSPSINYSASRGSQLLLTQGSQDRHISPSVVQQGRRGLGSSQERRLRPTPEERTIELDDNATQPLDDGFGPDPTQEDVEAVFGEDEASYTRGSPAQAHPAMDDEIAGVGEVTSQDISSPIGLTLSPAKPNKRHQREEDYEEAGDQNVGPALDPYLSSDEEGTSRSIAVDPIHLHYTQNSSINNSLPLEQPPRRASTTASSTVADTASSPTTLHPDSPEASSQPLAVLTITQKLPGTFRPRTPPLPPLPSLGTEDPLVDRGRKTRPTRSPRRSAPNSQDLPSSQNSGSFPTKSDDLFRKLQSAKDDTIKRRRVDTRDASQLEVKSSVSDEQDEFWEGNHQTNKAEAAPSYRSRSRSVSQEISSYPPDQPSETDIEEQLGLADKGKGKGKGKAVDRIGDSASSSSAGGPAYRTRSTTSSPSKRSPKSRTSPPRELRRKGSGRGSPPVSPRRTLRRYHSNTSSLRPYKAEDAVWARWQGEYYAGKVQRPGPGPVPERYEIRFLDGDVSSCEASQMRRLKFQLGAELMAKKTETKDYPAVVEGFYVSGELDQSRVDVRFINDDATANLALYKVLMTQDQMVEMDTVMNWDEDDMSTATTTVAVGQQSQSGASSAEASTSLSRQPSSVSTPSGTPRKAKSRAALSEHASTGSLTPSRRNRSDALPVAGPATPTRRGKGESISTKIKNGGGTVLEDFSSVIGSHGGGGGLQSNVLLIACSHLRTPKYIDALAMNIPRLSFRWIDRSVETRQLQPYGSYQFSTGESLELEAVVSATPIHDRGIFDGLQIGLCGDVRQKNTWARTLTAAGATVVTVTAKSGPMMCNYVVFQTVEEHRRYCLENAALPPLAEEWLIQCLINQRIMAVRGHPDYTDLTKKKEKKDVQGH
ncbi:hypothetical protein BGX29_010070, partial [Mortierella sp. GBA35]